MVQWGLIAYDTFIPLCMRQRLSEVYLHSVAATSGVRLLSSAKIVHVHDQLVLTLSSSLEEVPPSPPALPPLRVCVVNSHLPTSGTLSSVGGVSPARYQTTGSAVVQLDHLHRCRQLGITKILYKFTNKTPLARPLSFCDQFAGSSRRSFDGQPNYISGGEPLARTRL